MQTLTLTQAINLCAGHREFYSMASTPHEEECAQAGGDMQNQRDAIIECKALAEQLRRIHGKEPEAAEFFILKNAHDFGIYYELAIFYNEHDEEKFWDEEKQQYIHEEIEQESSKYMQKCENLPGQWDEAAKQYLRDNNHSKYQPAKVVKMREHDTTTNHDSTRHHRIV